MKPDPRKSPRTLFDLGELPAHPTHNPDAWAALAQMWLQRTHLAREQLAASLEILEAGCGCASPQGCHRHCSFAETCRWIGIRIRDLCRAKQKHCRDCRKSYGMYLMTFDLNRDSRHAVVLACMQAMRIHLGTMPGDHPTNPR